MSDDDPHDLALQMPFVACVGEGGPYDDDAFVAGWNCAHLDRALADGPAEHIAVLDDGLRQQADLIAMRHGYRAEHQPTDVYGWCHMRFTREQGVADG